MTFRIPRWCLTLGVIFFLLLTGGGLYTVHLVAQQDESYQYTLLFTKIIELVRQEYVDAGKVQYRDLIYAALRGMLSSLDPHSQFMDEEAFAEMQKDTKGQFSGLGLLVGLRDGFLTVLASIEDTPSSKAGILAGDRILKIDNKSTDKMNQQDAVKRLRGVRGSKVKLMVMRPSTNQEGPGEILEIELTREVVKVATVRDARILPDELTGGDAIGYLRIEQFGEKTEEEVEKALVDLEKKGMKALIIDLRNNPGGLLDSAVEVAGKFLNKGQVVVSTQGRNSIQGLEYRPKLDKRHPAYPLVLLVNGYSASGAEIVAGALKDLQRAILVGETTFGKGSVQTVQDLGNGTGIRLTTAKYYTPSKKVIHEVGVEPNLLAPVTEQEERLLQQVRANRGFVVPNPAQREVRDTQLDRAIGILKGIRIFQERTKNLPPLTLPVS
ncbi:MAG: S41 family peptidase [Verrucomicrobiota bacterium]